MAMKAVKKKLLVVDFGFDTGRVFAPLFEDVVQYRSPSQVDASSVIVYEGGSDISPELYQERRGTWTHQPNHQRDELEVALFNFARVRGAGFIGICRGAQLLTALAGGKLFQDVTGHHQNHVMQTDTGKRMMTTSIHHQMMNPFVLPDEDYKLIAWATAPLRGLNALSTLYLNGNDTTDFIPEREPEIVWYPKIKSLCIQGHPEYGPQDGVFQEYCRSLVKEYILKGA